VLAKVEYFNPGGSVKDRHRARDGRGRRALGALQPGGVIVEPTSGNTGVGLALVAQKKGYTCVFVCPDKVAPGQDRRAARVRRPRRGLPDGRSTPRTPRSYYSVSDRLAREIPGAWKPDQYSNPANPQAHYLSTGPEVWEQTEGRVTHFVAAPAPAARWAASGATSRRRAGAVKVYGADPVGSVYSGGDGRPYLVEGVGEDFWPTTYDASIPTASSPCPTATPSR
jgi:cystathionine beta-synthase